MNLTAVDIVPLLRFSLLGVGIDAFHLEEILSKITEASQRSFPAQIITANALMLLEAEKNSALREAFRDAALVIPDGAGINLAARLRGIKNTARIPGVDLMEKMCALASQKNLSVYFLGATPGTAEKTAVNLRKKYPGLAVAGVRDGYFSPEEEPRVLDVVAKSAPDFLFVALGVPRQDVWIHQNLPRFKCKIAMGVGGSFDVISGRLKRAPSWMRTLCLEWLYRLIQEPRRAGRMMGLPVFFFKILRDSAQKSRR